MSTAQGSAGKSVVQRSRLSTALTAVAIFVSVWIVAALYWKTTYHAPTWRDLLLCGVALPMLLVVGLALGRRSIERIRQPERVVQPAGQATGVASGDDSAQQWTMALLDSSLRLPSGITPEEIGDAAREAAVVKLHPDLTRHDGVRIFASGVASIAPDRFDESLLPPDSAEALNDEHRRAMLLAAETLDELMERQAGAASADANISTEQPSLKLHLLFPERWQPVAATLAAWLDAHLAREQWMPRMERVAPVCVADPVEALAMLDRLNEVLRKQPLTTRHIVLALDSSLGWATVDSLDNLDQLYTQQRPNGHVLGEGACALLLAHPAAADVVPAAHIHRLISSRLSAPVEQAGQQRGDAVMQLLDSARKHTVAPELEIAACALVSDADQRISRRAEMTAVAELAWPNSDISGRCLHLGLANGESGAVLALSAIAVAGDHSLREQQPTFAVSTNDATARGVMLVSLPQKPSAPSNAQDSV
ncbi:hypothetical protein R75461_07693 [Paraburkholderia nemoris]|uniref:hypothetical protein n=1 Tax=Paraburkholderia nemoris TaxID=2793076 RepID=UPI001B1E3E81|nr:MULTISPECIES: hypothetical protein [Paraburkholderia]CAE6855612.1 hypothetical protein R75461_07693 [Paraburkholderia nemoris]